MILEKLNIHNIASIGDATIDFSSKPLAGEKVFLICGDTGSGKTTILDSICLALYNQVPRLGAVKKEKTNEEDIYTSDSRLLLRRGAYEGFAEVYITGNDRRHYLARWSVSRSRKRIDGALQPYKWTWSDADTGEMISFKIKEIESNIIPRAIGLDFNQFCRTSMLAQGEFTKFLKGTEDEKSEILEKLTGTEQYSVIGRQIYLKSDELSKELDRFRMQIGGIAILSGEERTRMTEDMENLEKNVRYESELKLKTDKAKNWLETEESLKDRLVKAEKELEQAKSEKENDSFSRAQDITRQWKNTAEVRNILGAIGLSESGIMELEKGKGTLVKLCSLLINNTVYLNKDMAVLEGKIQENKILLKQYSAWQPIVTEHYTELTTLLSGLVVLSANLDTARKNLDSATDRKCRLSEEFSDLRQDLDLKRQARDRQAEVMKLLQEEADNISPTVSEHQEKLLNAATLARDNAMRTASAYEESVKESSELEKQLADKENVLQSYVREEAAAEEAFKQASLVYNAVKSSLDGWAKEARSRIRQGDVCPVCGQTVHVIIPDAEFEAHVAPLRSAMETAENTLEEKRKNRIEAQTSSKLIAEELERSSARKENALKANTEANDNLESALRDADATLDTLDDLRRAFEERKQDYQKLVAKRDAERTVYDELADKFIKADKAYSVAEKELSATNDYINKLETTVSESSSELATGLSDADKLIRPCIPDWNQTSIDLFLTKLKKVYSAYTQLMKSGQDLELRLERRHTVLDRSKEVLDRAYEPLGTDYSAGYAVLPEKDFPEKLESFARSLDTWIGKMQNANDLLRTQRDRLDKYMSEHHELSEESVREMMKEYDDVKIKMLQDNMDAIDKKISERAANLKAIAETEQAHQESRPAMNPEDTVMSLESMSESLTENIEKTNREIGSYRSSLENDSRNREKCAGMKEDMAIVEKEYGRWKQLCDMLGSADGRKFRRIAQSYILDGLLQTANGYLAMLSERYKFTSEPGSLTLFVEDAFTGGTKRPVSTLSGGESFQLSLSLALALSNMAGGGVRTDTLFIDEGFGTLSHDCLETAIEALIKIRDMGGRRVGIISHVSELKERISTRIEVYREDISKSAVRVTTNQ